MGRISESVILYKISKVLLAPFYYYFRYRRFPEDEPTIINIDNSSAPIKEIKIESIYFNPIIDPSYSNYLDYIKTVSNKIEIKNYNPYRGIPLYNSTEIGGFTEYLIKNIVFAVAYDIGKKYVKKLLTELKESNRIEANKYESYIQFCDTNWEGIGKIIFKFKDKKTIEITIPFPDYKVSDIDNIDFELVEKQFKSSKKAKITFSKVENKYKKGDIIDYFG